MSRSILLIDDEPSILRFLGRLFERLEWEVHSALSGEEGVQVYERHQPDLVLLDLHLPGLSGMQVLEVLVARNSSPPKGRPSVVMANDDENR